MFGRNVIATRVASCSARIGASILLAAAATLIAQPAAAQIFYLTATLDGAQETPPVPTPATGNGCFVLDTTANTLSYHIVFSGLTSAENGAHIHGFAPPGVPAGILFGLPPGSPKNGLINVTPAQATNILNGLTYVNIHTNNFGGGEIRGQIVQAPAHTQFCFGDGSVTACPCGNDSPLGSGAGCLNSIGLAGKLQSSGFASLACETLSLNGSDMFSGTAIYLQGNAIVAPVFFGDGLRCAGGNLKRLAVVTNVGGASQIPLGGGPAISVAGGITAPGTFAYQCYYRDPDVTHCPPNTFNVTSAVSVTWVP